MLKFDGRTAIVTGAGRGMGRTHALLLASRGANVVINDLGGAMDGSGSDAGPAHDVVEEIKSAGGNAVADTSSVATTEGAEAIVKTAVDAFGGVDIVVNNAGILTPHNFPETGPEDLERNLSVHLGGSFNVTRAAWPELIKSSTPRVVMTTSCALFGSPFLVAYGSAKGGLIGLGRNLATAGAEHGIKVNLIAPYAKTRMADPDIDVNEGARTEVVAEEPQGPTVFDRLLPENVSSVVAYLAHESCDLTGEVLSCGGGRVARIFFAETQGFGAADVTPEDIAANIDQICAERDYYVPEDITVYTTFFMDRVPEGAPVS
jgi:NAD(P)-dependent dehydrogenase (short-subunit alcohol dehydrogenase family)